jgi:hypothetical protein
LAYGNAGWVLRDYADAAGLTTFKKRLIFIEEAGGCFRINEAPSGPEIISRKKFAERRKKLMKKRVKNNVYWIGKTDWELESFHGADYSINHGSS